MLDVNQTSGPPALCGRLWSVLCMWAAITVLASPAAMAQTPDPSEAPPEQEDSAEDTKASEGGDSDADVEPQPQEGVEPPPQEDEGSEGKDTESEVLNALETEHGLSAEAVDSVSEVATQIQQSERSAEELSSQITALNERLSYLEATETILEEQRRDESLPEAARQKMSARLAVNQSATVVRKAVLSSLDARQKTVQQRRQLLVDRRDELIEQQEVVLERVEETQQRLEEAQKAEEEAREQVEIARRKEAQAADEQLRRLIKKRRQLLEEVADLAREKREGIQTEQTRHSEEVEEFTRQREEIDQRIGDFTEDPSEATAKNQGDPLFDDVIRYRREVRESYLNLVDAYRAGRDAVVSAEEGLEEARAELTEAKKRVAELGQTEVGEQQVKLAEVRTELAELELEIARGRVEVLRQRIDLSREQIDFYNKSIERMLPIISETRRDRFYAVLSDQNWESAWFGVQEVSRRVLDLGERRIGQAMDLAGDLTSLDLWSWLFGLLWRVLLILIGVFFAIEFIQGGTQRITTSVLQRRFFRRRPTLTIKVAELIRSSIRPVLVYFLFLLLVDYLIATFPEFLFLRWILDGVFLFWIVMTVVKVLVLPRRYRETVVRSPAPEISEFEHSGLVKQGGHADLLSMELTRARKLVRSIRIVLIFWLVQAYVPDAVTALIGHSVISWLVEQVFVWGLAIVVYLVLSTWKDDIARLFAQLAEDRLPRAVEFVQTHKDRFYGVLVIGVASVYVLVRELASLTKKYASDTEWSKRVSNFVFRKRIELQQRERNGEGEDIPADESDLPPEYLEFFEVRPVNDEPYVIPRTEILDGIVEDIRAWSHRKGQGSTAVPGESGIGKTTMLTQLVQKLRHEFEDLRVTAGTITEKFDASEYVLSFIAHLFGVETTPESRKHLVDVLNAQSSRVVILDDCHHLYMRAIGGFAALDTFLEVVNLTDDRHYWVLAFNKYAWSYVNRVRPREHFFGQVTAMGAWTDREIQDLIQRRNAEAGMQVSFTDLVVAHEEEGQDDFYEIIKTANGFFRLLQDFSSGNPSVALVYWERSIKVGPDGTLQVTLFRRPPAKPVNKLSDDHLFALTAIAQHGALNPAEIAIVINSEVGFCDMALNFFDELEVIEIDRRTGRAHITPLYFRQIMSRLSSANFLWE